MPADDGLGVEINPELDQHFLSNPEKLARIIDAAAIRPADHVVEIGSGIGTVAEHLSPSRSLTVIEYDANLITELARRVPHATVVQGDALAILPELPVDVLLSNLPGYLTDALVSILPTLRFRTALVTIPSAEALAALTDIYRITPIAVLEPDDFRPPQEARAYVAHISPSS